MYESGRGESSINGSHICVSVQVYRIGTGLFHLGLSVGLLLMLGVDFLGVLMGLESLIDLMLFSSWSRWPLAVPIVGFRC